MISFVGFSHAPRTLAAAALIHGLNVTPDAKEADLVFISQDAATDADGKRDMAEIEDLVLKTVAKAKKGATVVITSQVEPGFTRSLKMSGLFCMAETLRIKDAMQRAIAPEQFIVGKSSPDVAIPDNFMLYMKINGAKIHEMSYEEAEFSKIAINMFLAAQVDCTNRLAKAAAGIGANWAPIVEVLKTDKRIGPHAYLEPGRWQDSSHLLRDHYTLERILAR